MNSRASKNLAMSGGKSIARLIVGGIGRGLKRMKDGYVKSHKAKQEALNKYGTSAIFK